MNYDEADDPELEAVLAKHEGERTPMTDAEYAVWLAETRARIEASIADPRPPLTSEEVRAHFARRTRELMAAEDDAAA